MKKQPPVLLTVRLLFRSDKKGCERNTLVFVFFYRKRRPLTFATLLLERLQGFGARAGQNAVLKLCNQDASFAARKGVGG